LPPQEEHFAQSAPFCVSHSFYRPNAIMTLLYLRKFSSKDQTVVHEVSDGVFVHQLLEWNPISERITARIQTKLRKMSVVQCYAPTENAELDEKETFYSLLDKTLLGIKRSDIIVMMGDFNAQVGNNNQDIEHIMGRHGMPCDKENENRQLLIELCGKHGLVTGGTVFPHKEGHKVTWISPDKDKQRGNQ